MNCTVTTSACTRHDMRLTRRWLSSRILWTLLVFGLALWFAAVLAAPHARAATIEDSVGRRVEVPAKVETIVPAGAPAQVLLHVLAPEKLAGLVEPFRPAQVIYVDPKIAALPQIPVLTRVTRPGDIAMVAALKPNLVVDYGNASPRYKEANEKIEKALGVPAVLFGGSLVEASKVVRTTGGAIGASARAEAVASAIDDILRRVAPLAALADAERIPVYLARGADGLNAARTGTSFDEPIRLAGGRNVVPAGNGTFARMRVEDVVALKPAVVVFATRDALKSPLHAALPSGTKFLLDAGQPYPVLTGPPSLNRLIGLAALAVVLHGDKVKMEPEEVAALESKLFQTPARLPLPAPLQVQP